MGTEIFTFEPLEPEKMSFKDGNPTFRNMTKTIFFLSGFLAILSNGHHCTLTIQFLKTSHNLGIQNSANKSEFESNENN